MLGCSSVRMFFGDPSYMLRTAVRGFSLALFFACFAALLSGRESEQRRPPSRPSPAIANGLDALGLWQPESVRAILLLYSGKSLSKAKAVELEENLRKVSDKIEDRL